MKTHLKTIGVMMLIFTYWILIWWAMAEFKWLAWAVIWILGGGLLVCLYVIIYKSLKP